MKCSDIQNLMARLAEYCGGTVCAECVACGFCVGMKARTNKNIWSVAQDFEQFLYGECREY